MFTQNTCISEKLKDLQVQLDRSCTFGVMDPKFTLKSAQNTKFTMNHTLRWNNSNLIKDWETILTLNNYMGEVNSDSTCTSKFQVPQLGHGWL